MTSILSIELYWIQLVYEINISFLNKFLLFSCLYVCLLGCFDVQNCKISFSIEFSLEFSLNQVTNKYYNDIEYWYSVLFVNRWFDEIVKYVFIGLDIWLFFDQRTKSISKNEFDWERNTNHEFLIIILLFTCSSSTSHSIVIILQNHHLPIRVNESDLIDSIL